MEGKRDIRFSYSAIAEPISALFWNNRQFLQWGREAGYNSAEFFPFARAAVEIVTLNIEAISEQPGRLKVTNYLCWNRPMG